jgi:xanthine dehydrogenase accessory factor
VEIFRRILELRASRNPAALVTLVETRGSTPRKPGARMLVLAGGRTEGTIGGGTVEHVVKEAAARVLANEQPETVTYKLTTELAMCCGGQMTFFVEPLMHQPPLIVFGCGHVGSAIIYAAAPLGFEIVAVDDLEENASKDRLPQAAEIVNTYEPDELADLPFGDDAYVMIATREHALDQKLLELCVRRETRFLGVIGSKRKARLQRERLAAKGVDDATIARIECPVGLDIGAQTAEEIAVAVCARLIQVRRGGEARAGA